MNLIKSKIRFKSYGYHEPSTVILHHTAGGRPGSESFLKQKGLGYHYMIDKDGTVHKYNSINDIVGHASRANNGYIGVSYISGGALGPTNEVQIQASIALLQRLKADYGVSKVSNHATIDKIVAKRGWKSDPHYIGEKSEQNNWTIKNSELDKIAKATGLTPIKYNIVMSRLPIMDDVYPRSLREDDIEMGD
jgi:hypothetical protein